jgi:DNA invertase Pin-like site-specific DNA recombinase
LIVSGLNGKGVAVTFVKENLTFSADTSSPMKTLMLSMMGAFAEFERSMILERHREGIAAAKAAGNPTGRPETIKASRCCGDQVLLRSRRKQGSTGSRVESFERTLNAALKA